MISIAHSRPQSKSAHLQMNVFCIVFICLTFFLTISELQQLLTRDFLYGFGNITLLQFKLYHLQEIESHSEQSFPRSSVRVEKLK